MTIRAAHDETTPDEARLLLREVQTSMNAACRVPTRCSKSERGFTLVELSIVVTIVGVLAVLATVGYRRLMTSSHMTEATGMVNSIRVAQESYHAETGLYSNASASLGWVGATTNACPSSSPGSKKTAWNPACQSWSTLPVHVDGPLMYAYSSTAGTGTSISGLPTVNGNTITANTPNGEWYAVTAVGDPDGDGAFSAVLGTSASNDLMIQGDGN